MKKFIICILPFFVVSLILTYFLFGFEEVLLIFAWFVSVGLLVCIEAKWVEFVDKHIKD